MSDEKPVTAPTPATKAVIKNDAEYLKTIEAAEKLLREHNAVLDSDWGPGKPGKKKVNFPPIGRGIEPPCINGVHYFGVKEVTYDTAQQVMWMITNRADFERKARYGEKGADILMDMNTGRVSGNLF